LTGPAAAAATTSTAVSRATPTAIVSSATATAEAIVMASISAARRAAYGGDGPIASATTQR
jgi:hypothetical protein